MLESRTYSGSPEVPSQVSCPWFAIQVVARREKHVAGMLEYKGYAPFVPLQRVKEKSRNHGTPGDCPLFPGYLFCQFQPQATGLVVTTPGVVRILGCGRTPVPLRDEEVKNVQMIVDSGVPSESHGAVRIGSPVIVTEGPLRGLIGQLVKFKKKEKIAVSVSLLCRSVLIELDQWHIKTISGKTCREARPNYLFESILTGSSNR